MVSWWWHLILSSVEDPILYALASRLEIVMISEDGDVSLFESREFESLINPPMVHQDITIQTSVAVVLTQAIK